MKLLLTFSHLLLLWVMSVRIASALIKETQFGQTKEACSNMSATPITKAKHCRLAAKVTGREYGGADKWSVLPSSCICKKTDNKCYFNSYNGPVYSIKPNYHVFVLCKPDFQTTQTGSQSCDSVGSHISTLDECRMAADAHGKEFTEANSFPGLPLGCGCDEGTDLCYFNTDVGTVAPGSYLLCAGNTRLPSEYSCKGKCLRNAGRCWCDMLCQKYNDCCVDLRLHCPVTGR